MELIDNLNTDVWASSDAGNHKGFVLYTLVKSQMEKPGQFKYAVQLVTDNEDDCDFKMLTLDGASGKTDPLKNIRNAELISKDDSIVAINLDGDCVVRKDFSG